MLNKLLALQKLLLILLLAPLEAIAQNATNEDIILSFPLKEQQTLSGNFGELRLEHFHSGIDLKVGGVTGSPVLAADDGYIWLAKVSPSGYGNVVYLKHHNSHSTVYAHLHAFSSKLAEAMKELQYDKLSFAVDTIFTPESFPVKKGDIIGYAGNSGSSMGPHLHFELRDPNEVVLNPFRFFNIKDNIAPELNTLGVFTIDTVQSVPISRTTHLLDLKNVKGKNKIDSIIHVENPVYFGLEATDRMNGTPNRFGIRNMKAELDGVTFFEMHGKNILFDETRYLLSLIEYKERKENKKTLVKTYVEPGNMLSYYKTAINSGVIQLTDNNPHTITITVHDDSENYSSLTFTIQQKKERGKATKDSTGNPFRWNEPNYYMTDDLLVYLPTGVLYNDILFSTEKIPAPTGAYSPIFRICSGNTPLHKPISIGIKNEVPDSLHSKAVAIYYDTDSNKKYAVDGELINGYYVINSRNFGHYYVAADTIAPTITPLFKNNADMRTKNDIRVKISDNLSGIASYNGYIDDQWVLFEYDAKNQLLCYTFDKHRLQKGKKHTLKLEVADRKGNIGILSSAFTW